MEHKPQPSDAARLERNSGKDGEEDRRKALSYEEIVSLMEHDSYHRVRGKIRQYGWADRWS